MIEELMRETFARHEALAPAPEQVRVRIQAVARRRRRWRRGIAGGTAVALVALVALVFLRVDGVRPPIVADTLGDDGAPITFLVLGIDSRPYSGDLHRADTIMLAHLPADRSAAYLISIPRDEPATYDGVPQTLAGVYALGRTAAVRDAVRERTGITVDGTVEVDFAGLVAVTDAVGGVELCVDQRVVSIHTQRVYAPGCRRFSGVEALDYLRQRMSLPNGDLGRQEHGRDYLKALYAKLADADLIELLGVKRAAGDAVRTDLGVYELAELLAAVDGLRPEDVVSVAPPATMVGLEPAAAQLWEAVRSGTLPEWVVANPAQVG